MVAVCLKIMQSRYLYSEARRILEFTLRCIKRAIKRIHCHIHFTNYSTRLVNVTTYDGAIKPSALQICQQVHNATTYVCILYRLAEKNSFTSSSSGLIHILR